MSRLTVIVLAVFIITISVRCLADRMDESPSQIRKDDTVDADGDDVDRSASPLGYPNNRLRPGTYMPGHYVSGLPGKERLIDCYACTDCPKVYPNTTTKYCPYTNDITKNNKCIVYAEKYAQMDHPWYVRGCVSERGTCIDIRAAHDNTDGRLVKLVGCWVCDGDRCNINGVHRSLPNLITAVMLLVITPILGKYTLS